MPYKNATITVFKRYNMTVAIAFFMVVLMAFSITFYSYLSELSKNEQQELVTLVAQAKQLSKKLERNVQTIKGMQIFAEYSLKYQNEFTQQMPQLEQDGERFYLKAQKHDQFQQRNHIKGSITGIGDITQFSLAVQQELAMANALTPALISSKNVLEDASWIYYVSTNHFVNIYPWVSRDIWQYSDAMLTSAQFLTLQQRQKKDNKVVWSSPFKDAAGLGIMTTIAMGVYRENNFVGAMTIDISLASLHNYLTLENAQEQAMILFNEKSQVLVFKQYESEEIKSITALNQVLPQTLNSYSATNLNKLNDIEIIDDWLVMKHHLSINNWTLVKYQKYSEFKAPLQERFTTMFALLLSVLLAFLLLVLYMTNRSFIKPTKQFIRHIQHSSEGNPGKIKPNVDWLHWFQIVENIFSQNRTLLQQLKEQNIVLDKRVIEKTKELQASSEKNQRDYVLLRSVMNAIPELIIFNNPEGELIGCNSAFEGVAGQTESKMMGQKMQQIMPVDILRALLKHPKPSDQDFPIQYVIEANECSYEYYCSQFISEQGEILGTISVFRDITEAKNAQTALEKAKDQAEYANKVKTQFLANMSHEIRTPINAMQGMMDLLAETKVTSSQQHYIQNAQSASMSLLHLINELLDLSKIESGKMLIASEPINIAETVDKALTLNVAQAIKKGLTINVVLDASVPEYVLSDEMRIVQVLSNLLNNAVKFTEKGEVSLLIDTIALSDVNVLVRFKVIDTGIGIAKEKQVHLFEAFRQADESMTRKYGGSGLGLSICQQIVNLLGGEINLTSKLGVGSELSFVLPFRLPKPNSITGETKNNAISICVLSNTFTPSFIDTIDKSDSEFTVLNSLSDFEQKNFTLPAVLLVHIDELSTLALSKEQGHSTWCKKVTFIAIYQSVMKVLSDEASQFLIQLNIPYIILDTPLYRYSLDRMLNFLQQIPTFDVNKQLANRPYTDHMNEEPVTLNKIDENRSDNLKGKKQSLNNIKVLLVEDNLVNQLVAKELLLNMGAEVIIANDGQQALDMLEKETFDVVLMDIQMPIMDGLTATQKIRENDKYQQLPIIAMTAHARAEDKQRSISVGMNLHIAKPVTADILQTNILAVLKPIVKNA